NYLFVMYFFFQAEDGIRDRNVTGVQTCALPILMDGIRSLLMDGIRSLLTGDEAVLLPGAMNALAARIIEDTGFKAIYVTGAGVRSEERRVGKESRDRRLWGSLKNK